MIHHDPPKCSKSQIANGESKRQSQPHPELKSPPSFPAPAQTYESKDTGKNVLTKCCTSQHQLLHKPILHLLQKLIISSSSAPRPVPYIGSWWRPEAERACQIQVGVRVEAVRVHGFVERRELGMYRAERVNALDSTWEHQHKEKRKTHLGVREAEQ